MSAGSSCSRIWPTCMKLLDWPLPGSWGSPSLQSSPLDKLGCLALLQTQVHYHDLTRTHLHLQNISSEIIRKGFLNDKLWWCNDELSLFPELKIKLLMCARCVSKYEARTRATGVKLAAFIKINTLLVLVVILNMLRKVDSFGVVTQAWHQH